MKTRTKIIIAISLIIAIVVPIFTRSNRYYMDVFIMLGIYVILGTAMNLLIGYTGQISLGMAGFYGIGAYTSVLLVMRLHMPFIVGLVSAIVLCFVVGYVLGFPSTKLSFVFLGIATAGLNTIIQIVITNSEFTGRATGIGGIPALKIFGENITKLQYYYMVFLFLLIVLYVSWRIVNSKTGRALQAIRGNPIAASAVGINVSHYKLLVFAIASAFAGLAGTLYAFNIRYIQAEAFTTGMSFKILTMGIIGGMGSLPGGVIGSLVTGALPEFLRDFSRYQMTLYGLLIVVILRFMPRGIIHPLILLLDNAGGLLARLFGKRGAMPADSAAPSSSGKTEEDV